MLMLLLMVVPLSGCATKKDVRSLQEELQRLAERQEAALRELEELTSATQDTIRGQSESLFSLRGETLRRLNEIQDDLLVLQELAGQNQRDLASIRDQLASGRYSQGGASPSTLAGMRTDSASLQGPEEAIVPMAGGAEEMYQAGVRQFNRGSLTAARAAFEEFIQAYPSHPQVPRAHLYLADVLVQEEQLEEAIEAFLEIPELFPASDVVPEAYYRVVLLYLETGDPDEARTYLERVVNSYPDSGAAILARERLREIG
jgi:tol-pal system protein YbgF